MKRLASLATMVMTVLLVSSLAQPVPAQETEVEIRRGEVLQVAGNTVLLRVEGEGVTRYTIPRDFRFEHEGSEITVSDLREGMILSGVRLRTSGATEEEDIASAMEEIAEAPVAADAAGEEAASEEATAEVADSPESPAGDEAMARESAEAESAAGTASAAETTDQAAASSDQSVGMSPALLVGLVVLVLIVILLAARGLGGSEPKKARK